MLKTINLHTDNTFTFWPLKNIYLVKLTFRPFKTYLFSGTMPLERTKTEEALDYICDFLKGRICRKRETTFTLCCC
jgi:hypothetical protein